MEEADTDENKPKISHHQLNVPSTSRRFSFSVRDLFGHKKLHKSSSLSNLNSNKIDLTAIPAIRINSGDGPLKFSSTNNSSIDLSKKSSSSSSSLHKLDDSKPSIATNNSSINGSKSSIYKKSKDDLSLDVKKVINLLDNDLNKLRVNVINEVTRKRANSCSNINNNSSSNNFPTLESLKKDSLSMRKPPDLTYKELRGLLNKKIKTVSEFSPIEKNEISAKVPEEEESNEIISLSKSKAIRPRLLSHPLSFTDSNAENIQSAPVVSNNNNPIKTFLYKTTPQRLIYYQLRRASNFSNYSTITSMMSQSQFTPSIESMLSLTNRALVSFIIDDDFAGLNHLLSNRRVLVDDRNENGMTALMIASSKGKTNFVKILIEHGADVNAEDEDSWSSLIFASKEGHEEIVKILLECEGIDIEKRDVGNFTALIWACYKNRIQVARLLIQHGANVCVYGDYNVTTLAWASGRGFLEIVVLLLSNGAKSIVNFPDKYGNTPLIWSCRRNPFLEIVKILLEYGADVESCGIWTPLTVATQGNFAEIVKLLVSRKPNINVVNINDKNGFTPLSIACKEGFTEIAITLINSGAYININDRSGNSNLILACKNGKVQIVEGLLKKHADVNVVGKEGKSALYCSVAQNHVSVVKIILNFNPDIELATKDGETCLMKAVKNKNAEIVSLLIDKRAKVSAIDKNGDNCLHIAMRSRSKPIVELILRNPTNSQLLYRVNKEGETPYTIDKNSEKPILPQIFGTRKLNFQEDSDNLLGYNLYSSCLADMLSDPTLHLPIIIGLFAKWGSGKGFLIGKLRDEMKSFARQYIKPTYYWSSILLLIILLISSSLGVIFGLALSSWLIGICIFGGIVSATQAFFLIVWISNKRSKFEWGLISQLSSYLAKKSDEIRLICQVIFCHPPGSQYFDQLSQAQPLNFYFSEQGKISSASGGESFIVEILMSLYNCLESDFGISTRLYRAFRPKSVNSSENWKYRKLCCIPYFLIFLIAYAIFLLGIVLLVLNLINYEPIKNELSFQILMYFCGVFIAILFVANLYTIGRVFKCLIFSHQRQVNKIYAIKAEGPMHALKEEVNLITDMAKCLTRFSERSIRMVIVVDALDSAEQEKVLEILDIIQTLFCDSKSPFICLLAIDPHIISKSLDNILGRKGIELNINPVLNESNISGNDYLRNLVHLPFYLQNAALRKVKHVKMIEKTLNNPSKNYEENKDLGPQNLFMNARQGSIESGYGPLLPLDKSLDKKRAKRLGLKMSDSVVSITGFGSIGSSSNINKFGATSDIKKMLLGDEYFSDVNPRSMRRLLNIVHVCARLLKAFNIEFNWYYLSVWVNLTEQWPYILSWIIVYCEHFQKELEDSLPLKAVYEKVKHFIPQSKDVDPNVVLDRDQRKLDIYLKIHKSSLLISTLYIYLPFTISLDPYLRKEISEQYQAQKLFSQSPDHIVQSPSPASPFQYGQNLRYRNNGRNSNILPTQQNPFFIGGGPFPYPTTSLWPYQPLSSPVLSPPLSLNLNINDGYADSTLIRELKNKKLKNLSVDGVNSLLNSLNLKANNLPIYQECIRKNNINGTVLLTCNLEELKNVLDMKFGDWVMFQNSICIMRRDSEINNNEDNASSPKLSPNMQPTKAESSSKKSEVLHSSTKKKLKPLEKQCTLEQQLIVGALELLSQQAGEDARKGEDSSSNNLSPINSEPEPSEISKKSKSYLENDETDVLYVHGSTAELPLENSPSFNRKLEASANLHLVNESERLGNYHNTRTSSIKKSPKISSFVDESLTPSIQIIEPKLSISADTNLIRNTSFTGLSSPSFRNKHYTKKDISQSGKLVRKSSNKKSHNKSQQQQQKNNNSSSDISSDESQSQPLVKNQTSSLHSKKIFTVSSTKLENQQDSSSSPVKIKTAPAGKDSGKDSSLGSRISRIKSNIFGGSSSSFAEDQKQSSSCSKIKPNRDRYENNEDSSEPENFIDDRKNCTSNSSSPPIQFYGSDECWFVKSKCLLSTSNQSEIGSSPDEDLFMSPIPPPANSPFSNISLNEAALLLETEPSFTTDNFVSSSAPEIISPLLSLVNAEAINNNNTEKSVLQIGDTINLVELAAAVPASFIKNQENQQGQLDEEVQLIASSSLFCSTPLQPVSNQKIVMYSKDKDKKISDCEVYKYLENRVASSGGDFAIDMNTHQDDGKLARNKLAYSDPILSTIATGKLVEFDKGDEEKLENLSGQLQQQSPLKRQKALDSNTSSRENTPQI